MNHPNIFLLVLYHHCGRALIHHLGMVGANELMVSTLACISVEGVTIHFSIAIDHPILSGEVFAFRMDVEGVEEGVCGTQFATKIFVIRPESELVGVLRVVLDPIVNVVVGDAGACSKRNLTAMIWEKVERIMVVMFCDGEVAMKHHPMDEIGELTHATADALGGFSMRDGQSFLVAFAGSGASKEFPHREGFAWTNQQTINMFDSQGEIDRLVLL